MSLERGRGRRQGEHAGRDRDGHREHVVDEQGRGRDEAREPPEVVARDHVRAAARLVRVDRLAVGEDDDRQQDGDPGGDREDEVGRRCRGDDEDDERRLGRVRHRRERVRGEDREREPLREQGLVHLPARARAADKRALQPDGAAPGLGGPRRRLDRPHWASAIGSRATRRRRSARSAAAHEARSPGPAAARRAALRPARARRRGRLRGVPEPPDDRLVERGADPDRVELDDAGVVELLDAPPGSGAHVAARRRRRRASRVQSGRAERGGHDPTVGPARQAGSGFRRPASGKRSRRGRRARRGGSRRRARSGGSAAASGRARSSGGAARRRRAGSATRVSYAKPQTSRRIGRCVRRRPSLRARRASSANSRGVSRTRSPPRETERFSRSISTSPSRDDRLAVRSGSPERRPQAREQLLDPERLRHVVVRAGVERRDLLALLPDGREDEDGDLRPRAQLAADLDAALAREDEVEDDRVRRPGRGERERLLAGRDRLPPRSPRPERRLERPEDLRLVVDDEHARRRSRVRPGEASASGNARTKRPAAPGLGPEPAAVRLGEAARDREPEARPGALASSARSNGSKTRSRSRCRDPAARRR